VGREHAGVGAAAVASATAYSALPTSHILISLSYDFICEFLASFIATRKQRHVLNDAVDELVVWNSGEDPIAVHSAGEMYCWQNARLLLNILSNGFLEANSAQNLAKYIALTRCR